MTIINLEIVFKCLIVSEETQKGGFKINEKRAENQLPLLDIHIVDLVKDDEAVLQQNQGDEDKVSSSNERRRLLGTLLKPPYVWHLSVFITDSNLFVVILKKLLFKIDYNPTRPYVIGLTGGLASGKSSIRLDLETLGAATVDCDKLGKT
jgi:phosphopantetheine adenylyltransferase/dephospho-CoA kinase